MPAGHRVHLGITDAQMPAMRRLWDEGLCDLEWTRKSDTQKHRVCRVCPVRQLCAQTGADEVGEIWGGDDGQHCYRGHTWSGPGKCPECKAEDNRRWYRGIKARALANGVTTDQQRRAEAAARRAAKAAA